MKFVTVKETRHVIFLGAGASLTSGYPVGDSLRLRMCCGRHLSNELQKAVKKKSNAIDACLEHFQDCNKAIKLFRKGGFATVDEFSRLASNTAPSHVQDMKRLMKLALALHNPEDKFEDSDYYAFIQRLFHKSNLHQLKPSITIITFNYDCYLEYLLLTAYEQRFALSGTRPKNISTWYRNKFTGGFWSRTDDFDWARQNLNFNHYKLHGSITYGDDERLGFNSLFTETHNKRLERFRDPTLRHIVPPVVFPWELFSHDGKFIDEKDFIFVKRAKSHHCDRIEARRLFAQFKASWEGARDAVRHADKISFVGLSMHEYLERGFSFLLSEIPKKKVQVVVANKDNEGFQGQKQFHPLAPCSKVVSMLNRCAKTIQWTRSAADSDGTAGEAAKELASDGYDPDMTARHSFRDFIETELD